MSGDVSDGEWLSPASTSQYQVCSIIWWRVTRVVMFDNQISNYVSGSGSGNDSPSSEPGHLDSDAVCVVWGWHW